VGDVSTSPQWIDGSDSESTKEHNQNDHPNQGQSDRSRFQVMSVGGSESAKGVIRTKFDRGEKSMVRLCSESESEVTFFVIVDYSKLSLSLSQRATRL
jgi:hypothetical protein